LPSLNLGQITLRVKNISACLDFYQDVFGMHLLSRQIVEPYGFTLYFLASTTANPPSVDIDAVDNREWLWQRPYTTLELHHFWTAERCDEDYINHDGRTPVFWGIGYESRQLDSLLTAWTKMTKTPTKTRDANGVPF
jgi:catechol 2,3-dioxygenase-like lactoylglutathione lyase family enzyme